MTRAILLCFLASVSHAGLAQSSLTRTSAFEYDPISGLLVREIVEDFHQAIIATLDQPLGDDLADKSSESPSHDCSPMCVNKSPAA